MNEDLEDIGRHLVLILHWIILCVRCDGAFDVRSYFTSPMFHHDLEMTCPPWKPRLVR